MSDQSLGRAVLELTTDPRAFTKGLKNAHAQAKQFSNKLSGIQQSAQRMGRSMTRSMTLPIIALGAASTKMAADYEASMSKIVGLVGVARDQVDAWSEDILEISATFGKAPKEMADAMFFITSAGLRSKNAFDALTMAAKASAGGLGDMTAVADALTSAMNAYGAETLNAAAATDVLVATVREGKLEAADLASAIGTVIPLAAEMGVEFNEVGASIASLTRIGFSVEQSVTSLQAIMSGLLKPTEQANEAFAQFGTTAAQLRIDIRDRGLLVTLNDLKERIGDNDTAMAEMFPNVRALRGILGLMGTNAESTMQILANMRDVTGSTDKAFEEASNTLKFKFNVAMSNLKTSLTYIGLEIGPIILPVLEEITGWLKDMAQKFKDLAPETKQFMLKLVMLAAIIGPAALAFAGLIAVFKALSFAFVLLSNPYVALGVAIVAVTLLIVKNWDKLVEVARKTGDALSKIWEGTGQTIGAAAKNIYTRLRVWWVENFEILVLELDTIWMKIQNIFIKARNWVSRTFGTGQERPTYDAAIQQAQRLITAEYADAEAKLAVARDAYRADIEAGKALAREGELELGGIFTDIGKGIADKAKGLVDAVVGAFTQGKEVWEALGISDLISGIQGAVDGIGGAMTDAADDAKSAMEDGAEALTDAGDEVAASLAQLSLLPPGAGAQGLDFTHPFLKKVSDEEFMRLRRGEAPKGDPGKGGGRLKEPVPLGFLKMIMASDPVTSFLTSVADAAMQIENLNKTVNFLNTAMTAMFKILEPAINGVLKPIVDVIELLGTTIGKMLLPVIIPLAPIFDLIAQIAETVLIPVLNLLSVPLSIIAGILTALEPLFKGMAVALEIVTSPLRWFGDLLKWVGNKFAKFGTWLKHVFAFEFGKAGKVNFGGGFKSDAFSGLEDRIAAIWARDFSPEAVLAAGGAGAGATFEQQRPIFVTIDVHDNEYFGEGTWRDFAITLRDEFEEMGVLGI